MYNRRGTSFAGLKREYKVACANIVDTELKARCIPSLNRSGEIDRPLHEHWVHGFRPNQMNVSKTVKKSMAQLYR